MGHYLIHSVCRGRILGRALLTDVWLKALEAFDKLAGCSIDVRPSAGSLDYEA